MRNPRVYVSGKKPIANAIVSYVLGYVSHIDVTHHVPGNIKFKFKFKITLLLYETSNSLQLQNALHMEHNTE